MYRKHKASFLRHGVETMVGRGLGFLVLLSVGTPTLAWADAVTRGPYLQKGAHTAVTVRWRTDVSGNSYVRYGSSPSNLNQTASDSESTTEHEVRLTGLSPDTRYYYSVGTSSATLAGGNSTTYFETAPTPGTAQSTRIWVIGDSGTANSSAAAVYNAYRNYTGSQYTHAWLMLGDNAYNDGTDSEYQAAVFNMYPELLRQTVVWPTLGNHDGHTADSASESGPYYSIFSLPRAAEAGGVASGTEAYYSYDHANIHFVVLDSYDSSRSPTGPMLTWLVADLQATNADWLIAYWHHPPYTKGSHNSDTESALQEMRQNALPILEDYGVDLVLTGHSHSYERSYLLDSHYGSSSTIMSSHYVDNGDGRPSGDGAYNKDSVGLAPHEGTVYAVAGSSGKTSGGSLNHPAMFVSLNTLGSMVLDVNGPILDAVFLTSTGSVADSFRVVKGAGCTPTQSPESSCSDDVDNDCDGDVDADDTDCCADADADSYHAIGCGGTDCDDSDPTVHPGATEVCDDTDDNNCDADIDCDDAMCTTEIECGGSGIQTSTISAIDDTFVNQSSASTNYGNNTSIELDTSSQRKHALVRAVDFGPIPSGATIHSAELVLTVWDPGNTFEVRRATSSWSEISVTWNSRPSVASTAETSVSGANGERRADVTSLFQAWIDGSATNYGVELTPTGSDGVDMRSSEYGTASLRPYFEVEWSTSGEQQVTVTDIDDAYVGDANPNNNYGSNSALEVDTASVRKHAYIKANTLGGISSGAQIVSATLVLQVFDAGHTVEVRPVNSSWSESSVTWNNRPGTGSAATSFAGSSGQKSIDITDLVQAWVSGSSGNYGVELYPTGSNGVDIRSSEYGTSSQRPYIVIDYIP